MRCRTCNRSDVEFTINRVDCKQCRADYDRQRRYRISKVDYEALYAQQEGRCKICHDREKLVVDHCHTTDEVRGLLCQSCNRAIGALRDSITNFARAILYLDGSQASQN